MPPTGFAVNGVEQWKLIPPSRNNRLNTMRFASTGGKAGVLFWRLRFFNLFLS